jgi:hypothetical protein
MDGVYDLAALLPYAKSKHNLYTIFAVESKLSIFEYLTHV